MNALADYALEKHINFAYNDLVKKRFLVTKDEDSMGKNLDKATQFARIYGENIVIYKAHNKLLGDYFEALDTLVDANVKESGGASLKEAASGLNAVGKVLGDRIKISTEQLSAIGTMGEVIFTAIHGDAVKKTLQKDAVFINRQIALQKFALDFFSEEVQSVQALDDLVIYQVELRKSYVSDFNMQKKAPLAGDFKNKWTAIVKEPVLAEQLATAKRTAEKLQIAWKGILEGKKVPADLLGDIALIKSIADQAKVLHENRSKPAAP